MKWFGTISFLSLIILHFIKQMNSLPYLSTTLNQLPRCSSTGIVMSYQWNLESISFPLDSLAMSSDSSYSNDEGRGQTITKEITQKAHHTRSHHVTTIQEYTQLVIMCMKKCKKLNTTEVAKSILSSVRPKTTKLVIISLFSIHLIDC